MMVRNLNRVHAGSIPIAPKDYDSNREYIVRWKNPSKKGPISLSICSFLASPRLVLGCANLMPVFIMLAWMITFGILLSLWFFLLLIPISGMLAINISFWRSGQQLNDIELNQMEPCSPAALVTLFAGLPLLFAGIYSVWDRGVLLIVLCVVLCTCFLVPYDFTCMYCWINIGIVTRKWFYQTLSKYQEVVPRLIPTTAIKAIYVKDYSSHPEAEILNKLPWSLFREIESY